MTRQGIQEQIGRNLKRLRTARGFSQATLAAKAELGRRRVGATEKGSANNTIDALDKLAAALDADITTFFLAPDTEAPTLERRSLSVPRQTTPRSPGASPVYTEEDYFKIADAVSLHLERVLTFAGALDEQALWFRIEKRAALADGTQSAARVDGAEARRLR
jgi:transcriptional regulator with XRE-family HTH domain